MACLAWVTLLVVPLLSALPPVSLEHPVFPAEPYLGLRIYISVVCSGDVNEGDVCYESLRLLVALTYIFHYFFLVVFYSWINFVYPNIP